MDVVRIFILKFEVFRIQKFQKQNIVLVVFLEVILKYFYYCLYI